MHNITRQLLTRFKTGDASAFHEIYECTFGLVYSVANKFVNDRQETEDLVHDIYVRLFDKRELLDLDSNFTSWLHKMAINHCINYINRKRIFFSKIINYFINNPAQSTIDDHQERLEQQEDIFIVRKLLNMIDEPYRVPLILKDMEGFSLLEIAQMLNMNISTVKTRISRARKHLEQLYAMEVN